jgi:hypothetical protein
MQGVDVPTAEMPTFIGTLPNVLQGAGQLALDAVFPPLDPLETEQARRGGPAFVIDIAVILEIRARSYEFNYSVTVRANTQARALVVVAVNTLGVRDMEELQELLVVSSKFSL